MCVSKIENTCIQLSLKLTSVDLILFAEGIIIVKKVVCLFLHLKLENKISFNIQG